MGWLYVKDKIQCSRRLGNCRLAVRQRQDSVFKEVEELSVGCTSKDEGITGLIVDSLPPTLPLVISMRHKSRQFTNEV